MFSKESAEIQFNLLVKEALDYAIFVIDIDGTILSWNAGAERIKQFTANEVLGQNFEILYRDEDRKQGRPMDNIKKTISADRFEEQWWRQKKDGSIFWADVIMNAIYSASGELIGVAKIVHDISVKKNLEDELASAKKSADEARSLKSIFIANMSHENFTKIWLPRPYRSSHRAHDE
ncbi:MAG: PAS domain S-box protein [Bdellovibrionota bacterium]